MMLARLVVALGLVLLIGTAAAAAAPLDARLTDDTDIVSVAPFMDVLADQRGDLTAAQVTDPAHAERFTPLSQAKVNGYTDATLWYRLTVSRTAEAPSTWLLQVMPPYLNDVRVYQPDDAGGMRETRLGDHVPYADRAYAMRGHVVEVSLPDTQPRTLFIRVNTNSSSILTAVMGPPESMMAREAASMLMLGMFFGCLAIVALIHAAAGLWVRDRATLSYALFVACLTCFHANINGLVSRYLDPAAPSINDLLTGGSVLLSAGSAALMWDQLLGCRQRFPGAHRVFMATVAFCILAVPTATTSLYPTAAVICNFLAALTMTLGVVLAGRLVWLRENDPGLTFYFVGMLGSWLGLMPNIATTSGLLPLNTLTAYAFQATSLFHVVLLAFGLSHRLREMDRVKTVAERDSAAFKAQAAAQRRFVQMLSHEFRAPLASISQAAQMVQLYGEGMDEAAQARLSRIRARAARLSGLVDVFLARETLTSATLAATPGPMRADTLVAAAVDRSGGGSDRVRVSIMPPDLTLHADDILLPVALGNVVENALKYSDGESTVSITVCRGDDGVGITVENTGEGLTAEDAVQADAPHYRGAASKGHDGSGLGLHIARQIMAAHGGDLKLRSAGTTTAVTLELPPPDGSPGG